MQLQDFDFTLPPELIAQHPVARRDQARLMVVDRAQQRVTHDTFANLGHYLHAGDVLVVNDTKVIPARLRGRKVGTGGKVEVLLLHELQTGRWEVLLKPAAKVRLGMTIGLMPITGLPLPLLSYGGSFVLASMTALGLLQNVWIHRRVY